MKNVLKEIERKRELLNHLLEDREQLSQKDKALLQQISEEMDELILAYIKLK